MSGADNGLPHFAFCHFSGLLSMQWIAEAATLNQALCLCGHPVQWWMTAGLKVFSPLIFATVLSSSLILDITYIPTHNYNSPNRVHVHSVRS